MIADPSRSTVVAWYDTLPDGLALLVERVQATAGRLLGGAFTARVTYTDTALPRASTVWRPL